MSEPTTIYTVVITTNSEDDFQQIIDKLEEMEENGELTEPFQTEVRALTESISKLNKGN